MVYDCIIIGAGPAGLTAGLYAGRYGLSTLILEKSFVGGQIVLSPTIENFPGFPGGIETAALIERMKQQVVDVGVAIESHEVVRIETAGSIKKIITQDTAFETKSIIVATGAMPKRLGVPGEDSFIGRGVSYCGTCDGPLYKDKEICVVGGGDRALEEALYLTHYARRVNLIHRRAEFRGSKILAKAVKEHAKINVVMEHAVVEITGTNKVSSVVLEHVKKASRTKLACEGVFIFVGILPNTECVKSVLQLDANGFIITGQSMETSCEGVFAAGDCRASPLWQVVTAVSDGAIAAQSAHQYVSPYK